jgi:hypothetical protein
VAIETPSSAQLLDQGRDQVVQLAFLNSAGYEVLNLRSLFLDAPLEVAGHVLPLENDSPTQPPNQRCVAGFEADRNKRRGGFLCHLVFGPLCLLGRVREGLRNGLYANIVGANADRLLARLQILIQ